MDDEANDGAFFYFVGDPSHPLFEVRRDGRRIFSTYYHPEQIIDDLIEYRIAEGMEHFFIQAANMDTVFQRTIIHRIFTAYGLDEPNNPFTSGDKRVGYRIAGKVLKEAACRLEM